MAEDKELRKYAENLPYGKDAKPSEIHGLHNKAVINGMVTDLMQKFDESKAKGDKKSAGHYSDAIRKIALDCENLQIPKEEYLMLEGGGVNGASQFSNYTNRSWERKFFTEQGTIGFSAQDMSMVLTVLDDEGKEVSKGIKDVTQDWVMAAKREENEYMKMQQDAMRQRNTMGTELDFDVDWHVSNLLGTADTWKSFVSDKVGGRYFLQDWMQENQEAIAAGEIPDEMLHPDSFNPEFDNRLHDYYASRIKKSFDPNYQTFSEIRKTEELMARMNQQNNTKNTQA